MATDITFEELHDYVMTSPAIRQALPDLPFKGQSFKPMAIYAAPLGHSPVFLSESGMALRESEGRSAALKKVTHNHDYYQIYYELPGELGDVAVQLWKGDSQCRVSLWDKQHQNGINLGTVEAVPGKNLLDQVSTRLGETMQFMVLLNSATRDAADRHI